MLKLDSVLRPARFRGWFADGKEGADVVSVTSFAIKI
jgi:hypothetical protein